MNKDICKPVHDFFKRFRILYTTDLPFVMDEFEMCPTIELQKQVRLLLVKEIATNEAIKKIEGLHSIVESCRKTYYNTLSKKEVLHVTDK